MICFEAYPLIEELSFDVIKRILHPILLAVFTWFTRAVVSPDPLHTIKRSFDVIAGVVYSDTI